MPGESGENREWTILLLVDSSSGRASVTAGYQAEVWLSDEMWSNTLAETAEALRKGHPDEAVVLFLKKARVYFESAWKRSQKQLVAR